VTRPEHKRAKHQARLSLRIAVLMLTVVAMLGVSAAADSAEHFHTKSPASGCNLCFNAHVAAEQARPLVCLLDTPEVYARFVPGSAATGYQLLGGNSTLTRGPPSLAL